MNRIRTDQRQQELLYEINVLRGILNEMSRQKKELTHPRVLELSQLLDKKLNDYQRTLAMVTS